jgi:nitric oxide reductase NorD protein
MPEFVVGKLWDRLLSRAVESRNEDAAVLFEDIVKPAGILFRALGGDKGLTIKIAQSTLNQGKRGWLQRIAGSEEKIELAWRDHEALYLPSSINLFADVSLNRELYFWLAALAVESREGSWFTNNQQATLRLLEKFPGLQARYQRLLHAVLLCRPEIESLSSDNAAQEKALRQALTTPGSVSLLPLARYAWHPVHLWLHPTPPLNSNTQSPSPARLEEFEQGENTQSVFQDERRHKAERQDVQERKDGFMMFFRAESILSWAEYIKVNRPTDDDENEDAKRAADEMDTITVTRDGKTTASRIRFDLDLPPEESDDTPLGGGILLPEWHYKKNQLLKDYCCLQPMVASNATPSALPAHLAVTAQRIRRQFETFTSVRVWQKKQDEGSEIDVDAYVQHKVERQCGTLAADGGLFKALSVQERDLSCLLLADLSQSTDAYVNNDVRVIDVIRDSLFLFSEALFATADRFGLYGFSSLRRDQIRFHVIKSFDEKYNDQVRGRIAAIKPGYYTRMGAAIRHAGSVLAKQASHQRILLLLTDGKPNDLDLYEGRYGIEDTRKALNEVRSLGIRPFCVTVDEKAGSYLPYLFGAGSFIVIHKQSQLPQQLLSLYAQITH